MYTKNISSYHTIHRHCLCTTKTSVPTTLYTATVYVQQKHQFLPHYTLSLSMYNKNISSYNMIHRRCLCTTKTLVPTTLYTAAVYVQQKHQFLFQFTQSLPMSKKARPIVHMRHYQIRIGRKHHNKYGSQVAPNHLAMFQRV